MIDPDDQENYSVGNIHKKTLQPKTKYIGIFDSETFLNDWRNNCISERSFRCTDLSFFNDESVETGDQSKIGSNIRHGLYAYSSKDWDDVKEKMIEEAKQAREEWIKLHPVVQKTPEQLLLEKLNQEAQEIKNKILPTKVKK